MKKLFVIFLCAAALSFQACKEGTSDKDTTIDDGMQTSETSIGTGSTRPSDRDPNNAGNEGSQGTGSLGHDGDTAHPAAQPITTEPDEQMTERKDR